jgi:hypothetical protein
MMTCDLSLRRRAVEGARGYTGGMPKPAIRPMTILAGVLALLAGCAIAWMDTRPGWDDTGVTAGALFLASALASSFGVAWWLAPVLVAGPVISAEIGGLGWGALVILGVSVIGAGVGTAVRRTIASHDSVKRHPE